MQHVDGVPPDVPPKVENVFLKLGAQPLHGRAQPGDGVRGGAVEDEAGAASFGMLKKQQHRFVKVLLWYSGIVDSRVHQMHHSRVRAPEIP